MSETFTKCAQKTSLDSRSATSSPALEDGPSRSNSPNGQRTEKSGRRVVPASRIQAPLEVAPSLPIYGRPSAACSLQERLMSSLASRLPVLACGSMASAMTWKRWTTKSRRQFSRLAVSVRTMRALGFTLWATPTATANQGAPSMRKWIGCRGIEVSPDAWRCRMGFPVTWEKCVPMVMPFIPGSRKSLSKRISTAAVVNP